MLNNDSSAANSTFHEPGIPKIPQAIVLGIGILSVVFNGVLLIVMMLNSKQVFASLGSYFIANLAIADFITGVNSFGWGLSGFLGFNVLLQQILLRVFWITVQVSFYTIFVMSTERLMAIVFPFRASLIMSRKKTIIYCIAVWVIAILLAGSNQGDVNTVDTIWFAIIVVFEVVILIIVIEYIFVFRQLRALWLQSKTRVVYTHNSQTAICTPSKQATDVQREYQVTIVVICLAVILIVTVFPYNIAMQVFVSCNLFGCSASVAAAVSEFMWYYFPIELLNFVVNPIVYAWRLPKYRNAFLVTFRLKKRNNANGGSFLTRATQQSSVSGRGLIC